MGRKRRASDKWPWPHYPEETFEAHLLKFSFLKENSEYRKFWEQHRREIKQRKIIDLGTFGFPSLEKLSNYLNHGLFLNDSKAAYDLLIDLLDPTVDHMTSPFTMGQLKILLCASFDEKGIIPLYDPWERKQRKREGGSNVGFQPYERVLKIDLRKKKSRLLKEFKEYIEKQETIWRMHKKGTRPMDNVLLFVGTEFPDWDMDQSRLRKEVWQHLKVWKAGRLQRVVGKEGLSRRKQFPEIGKELNITPDAAKKSYYRAYELIQGRPFNPDLFKREFWVLRRSEIRKTCDTCELGPSHKDTCDTMCPDVLAYVDQDTKTSTEWKLVQSEKAAFNIHDLGTKDDRDFDK